MKKTILLTTMASAISTYAVPTYEPFTESTFVNAIAASGSNAVDLCTGGFTAPTGEVWGNMVWSGTFGTNIHGLDILVTNNPVLFTQSSLSTLLPATFPGMPASGQSITNVLMNPAQPLVAGAPSANIIGNSAVLRFNKDINRTNGPTTLYISYLWSVVGAGQLGAGNDARYLAFVSQSNTVEGTGTGGFYTTWSAMLDQAPGTCNVATHSIIAGGSGYYNVATDNSAGKEFTTSPFTAAYNAVQFIVGAVTLTTNKTYTNTIWVNPSTSSFGGAMPPASPIFNDAVISATLQLNDIGGMVVEDRPGHGANEGGLDSNYMANILIGTTWSYVTGGPEFTNTNGLPANTLLAPGGNMSLSALATAAGQTVNYQWQHNGVNVTNGVNGTGGGATVTGATNSTLTLTGLSSADGGSYSLVGTASSTGFSLASPLANLIISDPGILSQPQPATANAGGTASFTVQAETTTSGLSYAWYKGSTMLVNGLQPTGSTAFGAQGTNGTGTSTLTLTLTNVVCGDDGNYSLIVSNALGSNAVTTAGSLTVNDPYFVVQPPATAEVAQGTATSISISVAGTGLTYQWYSATSGQLSNSGDDSGVTTPTLTITNAQPSDAGTYYVQVSGSCGGPLTSSNTVVYFDTAATSLTIAPPALTQQVGTHLALVSTVSGGSGLIHLVPQLNGTPLASGIQADGSFISYGVLTGPGLGAVVLSNLTVGDSGAYTILASNAAGIVSSSPSTSLVTVVPTGQISLATTNLIVSRVGDGLQPLSGATGNTLYLDQFTTNGNYLNTVMVPDSGPSALIVAGGAIATGNEGAQEAYITVSSNQQFINFGGFCYSYPYTGGADVTVGQQEAGGSVTNVRGIYAINGAGIMALVYTNYGLYSGGHGFRDVYSTDGLTNFWTTGFAGAGTVKYVNAGPAGASYTITSPGQGIPALSAANSGGVSIGLVGTNLVFADNETDGNTDPSTVWGLDQFVGAPETATTATTEILPGGVGHADDFAFSPDLNTVYLADDDVSTGAGGYGGIQRWDYYGGQYNYSYNLSDGTGTGTNGTRGLVVVWPSSITTWGSGVEGAIIYATTSETVSNRIIQITDNAGSSSTATVLATAGANQFYRGIRFGPIQVPLSVSATPSSQSAYAGQSVDLAASTTGFFSYYFPNAAGTAYNFISVPPATFQWYDNGAAIPGATNFLLNFPNVQTSNAGSYSFVLTTGSTKVSNSVPAVVTVNPFGVNSNLVAWYQFDDGSGTNAVDSSIYGDTAALYNFPTNNSEWVTGLGGLYALNFANADSNGDNTVLAPDEPQLNFTNNLAFSLTAWINSESNNQPSAALISKGFGNGGEQYNLDIYTGYLRFFVRNNGGTVYPINSTYYPASNQWVHVGATMDGNAGSMYLYANGQLIGSNSAPNSLLYSTNPLSIGNRTMSSTSTNDLPFVGKMQDVRLYSFALGPEDVETVYLSQNLADYASTPHFATNPAVSFVAGGQLQLNLGGLPGTTFHLWSTTNLALTPVTSKWTLVTTGTFNTNGIATYVDTTATGSDKFYVVTQP